MVTKRLETIMQERSRERERKRLEQLRILEQGGHIAMAQACEYIPAGVDTPDDLQRVREIFESKKL